MKTKNRLPLSLRMISAVLAVAQLSMGAPVQVCAAGVGLAALAPATRQQPPTRTAVQNVQLNGSIPQVAPPAQFPQFSSAPTDAEIFRARVFEEPLIPTTQPEDKAENLALASAISAYLQRRSNDDTSAITQFLSAYPTSRWRAAILLNLGIVYRWTGYFSKALESWNGAWGLLKNEAQPQLKALADRALAEFMELNARVGRYETLGPLLEETQGRGIRGSADEKISGVKQGFWMMNNKPGEAFLCGPLALSNLFAASHGRGQQPPAALAEARSTRNGFSLAQLQTLADQAGMKLRMAKRHPGAAVPIPSLVNWKIGHYAALVKEDHGRYLVKDPTFAYDISVSRAALDAESSGYFLIPAGDLPPGWEPVTLDQAGRIWGKGNSGVGDPNHDTPNDKKCKDDPCDTEPGMAHYNFHALVMSLNIVDSPVGYTPPRGPSMKFKVTYNQREATQSAIFTYSNMGQKWTHDWLSYVQDDPMNSFASVLVILGGGGAELYKYNWYTQTYDVQRDSQTILTRFTSPSIRYERQYPDGSKDVYGLSDGATTFPRKVFLMQRIDPAGNPTTFTYDAAFRLVAATDALQQVTSFSYELSGQAGDELLITKVTDPFGRFAKFDYSTTVPRQLNKITDVVGIVSQFGYSGDFINTMTTPYGTTTFITGESGVRRWLEATDPTGAVERAEFNSNNDINDLLDSEPVAPNASGLLIANYYLKYRNTYYWDKKTMEVFLPDPINGTNYTKARIWHWYHGHLPDNNPATSSVLESEKKPLENRVWYNYADQQDVLGDSGITLALPTKVARVLSDGSTQLWQYTYNSIGKLTQAVDPRSRVTSYVYDTNNIDLLSVSQGSDLVASYSNYNSLHQPQTSTDAAGQTTTFTYNTYGQILTRENAKHEITTFGYGDGSPGHPVGYLTSITSPPFNSVSAVLWFAYDDDNRVRTVTDSDAYTVTTDYDNLDRPTQITYPDGTNQQFQYSQDFGQGLVPILDLTANKDRRGLWTTRHYNVNRQVDWIADPRNKKTRFGWCNCGALESIKDPKDQITTFNRDIQGRVYQKVFFDGTAINYLYAGQMAPNTPGATSWLQSATDAKNQRTNYTYFADGDLQQISYTDTNGQPLNPPTPTVAFAYDTNYNRVLTMTDGSGPTTYTYNPVAAPGAGRLSSIDGPLANDTITFGYDELGRVISRSINGTANSQTWTFDSLGRLSSNTNRLGPSNPFIYTYVGVTNRLDILTYPGGQTADYSYFDNLEDKRLQQIKNQTTGSVLLSQFDYTYDDEGQVKTWTKNYPGLSPAPQRYDLVYDNADRLKRAPLRNATTNALITNYLYDYDDADNRTVETIAAVTTNSTPNSVNEIVSQSGGTNRILTWDANGNLTIDGSTTYEWDAANRLVAINYTGTTNRSEFTYDGLSRPVKIIEKTNGSVTSARKFVWCGTEQCEFRDGNDAVTSFLFPQGEHTGGVKYFYARDHLGSIREMFRLNGTVVARYDYDPWGRSTTVVNTTLPDFNFTGLYRHSASNLDVAVRRFYDPDLGRWISRDPIEEHGGINLYGYGFNDPLNNVDPSGLDIAVAVGFAPGPLSPFGHVAAAVTGQGTFSYGTIEPFGSSFTDYLQNQSAYRATTVFVLPANKDQDDAFLAAFKKVAGTGKSRVGNNCADAVAAGLKEAGLLNPNAAQTFPSMINGYMELRASEGKVSAIVVIPQGVPAASTQWNTVNQLLGSFNP